MAKEITSRNWELVTFLKHSETGETLIDINEIDNILKPHSQVMSYGWIIHDKDTYSKKEEKACPDHKEGTLKRPHIHLVIKFSRTQELKPLAKWFGFEEKLQFFQKKNNGRGKRDAYLDSLTYLTHEDEKQQKEGKYLYPDEEVHFWHENGQSFREFLDAEKQAVEERKNKYGKADISRKEQLRYDVMYNGLTIKQLRNEHKIEYLADMEFLKKCRGDYLSNCPPPPFRINIYIDGQGGAGKSLISKAIARAIIDPEGKMEDEDIFCNISGDDTVAFESYDGQKVLIWDDFRSKEVLEGCASKRGNVFKIFAVNPDKTIQKKKYSSVNLINEVNIVNSVQHWREFLDGLAGEFRSRNGELVTAEDKYKAQSYRRFPIIVTITDKGYEIRTNNGFFGTGNYSQWTLKGEFNAVLKDIISDCGTNKALYNKISTEAVKPIVECYEKVKAIMINAQKGTDEEIIKRYTDVGMKMPDKTPDEILQDFINYAECHKGEDRHELFNKFAEMNGYIFKFEEIKRLLDAVKNM